MKYKVGMKFKSKGSPNTNNLGYYEIKAINRERVTISFIAKTGKVWWTDTFTYNVFGSLEPLHQEFLFPELAD